MKHLPIALALVLVAPLANAEDRNPPAPETLSQEKFQALAGQLAKGGYVFYFRHAATRHDQEDHHPAVLEDCASQRNLSQAGKDQAAAIGAAFRELRIPVGRVIASPYCRCMDTARLAFSKFDVSEDLHFAIGLDKSQRQVKGEALRQLLAQPPAPGTNTVLVAHTANLDEATGIWPKPEGAAVLFRPDGQGSFRAVGRIPPELWSDALAKPAKKR